MEEIERGASASFLKKDYSISGKKLAMNFTIVGVVGTIYGISLGWYEGGFGWEVKSCGEGLGGGEKGRASEINQNQTEFLSVVRLGKLL